MGILSQNTKKKISLPCGCMPGYFQCQVSQQLWENYEKIARLYSCGMATNLELQNARNAYEAHYAALYEAQP